MNPVTRVIGCAGVLLLLVAGSLHGQSLRGRVSLQMKGSTIERSVAPGVHFDAQLPLVGGLSAVGGAGISAFVLEGRRNGTYTFTPEVGLNVTLPSRSKGATMLSAGGGYYIPFGPEAGRTAPTVHLGLGRLRALQESTVFFSLSPTIAIRRKTTAFLLPLRTGVIF